MNRKLYSTIHKYVTYGTDKFYEIIYDLVDRADGYLDNDDDIEEAINVAIDTGMIYTDDQWEAYRHYCDIGDDQNIMWEGLWNDLYSIVSDLIEEDTEDEEEE